MSNEKTKFIFMIYLMYFINFIYVIHLMCWNYLADLITHNRKRNNRSNSRDGDTWRALFYDGLHFNGEGNQAMYRIVREELEAIGLEPDELPMHRPSMLGRAYPQVYDESGRPKPRTTKMRR